MKKIKDLSFEECVKHANEFITKHETVTVEMCDDVSCRFVANIKSVDSVIHMLEFGTKIKLKTMDDECAYAMTIWPPTTGCVMVDSVCKVK